MIVYRAISKEELLSLSTPHTYDRTVIKGENTFKYNYNIDYIHFFKYAKHAFDYAKRNKYVIVAKIDIPDDIELESGFGLYSGIKTHYDDSLEKYYIPIPEYRLKRIYFDTSYIIDYSNELYSPWEQEIKPLINEVPNSNSVQYWTTSSLYYEYIKFLKKLYKYNLENMIAHLEQIDIDETLKSMREQFEEINYLTLTPTKKGRKN